MGEVDLCCDRILFARTSRLDPSVRCRVHAVAARLDHANTKRPVRRRGIRETAAHILIIFRHDSQGTGSVSPRFHPAERHRMFHERQAAPTTQQDIIGKISDEHRVLPSDLLRRPAIASSVQARAETRNDAGSARRILPRQAPRRRSNSCRPGQCCTRGPGEQVAGRLEPDASRRPRDGAADGEGAAHRLRSRRDQLRSGHSRGRADAPRSQGAAAGSRSLSAKARHPPQFHCVRKQFPYSNDQRGAAHDAFGAEAPRAGVRLDHSHKSCPRVVSCSISSHRADHQRDSASQPLHRRASRHTPCAQVPRSYTHAGVLRRVACVRPHRHKIDFTAHHHSAPA